MPDGEPDPHPGSRELPAAIGRPALRALEGAGVRSLDDVARTGRAGLLRLHGVGPRAVGILERELEARGRRLDA